MLLESVFALEELPESDFELASDFELDSDFELLSLDPESVFFLSAAADFL